MLIDRKRVVLGGVVLLFGMSVGAWAQDPMLQPPPPVPAPTSTAPAGTQAPAAQTPAPKSDVPPPLQKPVYTKKKKDKKDAAPSDMPPPLAKPVVEKKNKKDLQPDKTNDATPATVPTSAPAAVVSTPPAAPQHVPAPSIPSPSPTPANTQVSAPPPALPPPPRVEKQAVAKKKTKQPKNLPTPAVSAAPVEPQAAPTPAPTALPPLMPPPAQKSAVAKNKKSKTQPTGTDASSSASQATEQGAGVPPLKKVDAPKKKGKQIYTGPNTIIEQPATPMLDADGKQRLDFDGNPMFNPPVKQQRDKNGHPLFDDHGKPVFQTATDLGFDDKGKRIKPKKEKVIKTTSIAIAEGTLTVDGMIGKATLNYDIKDFHYIYMYAPWIGTVVVSNRPFPGSKEQAKAFDQHTLTVTVEDHQFQLFSEKILLGKKPEPGYVAVDRNFKLESKFPAIGYGTTLQSPYNWPGAKGNPESKAYVKPPPVPKELKQTRLLQACPDGMARTGPPAPGTAELSCVAMEAPKTGDAPGEVATPAAEAAPTVREAAPAVAAPAAPASAPPDPSVPKL